LFEIENTLSFNKELLTEGATYDYVTRTSQNQGILQETGFVNSENINSAGNWSLGLLQMDFFYRDKPWYAGQFVRKITPKIKLDNKKVILFFTVLLNKHKSKLLSVLVRDVDDTFRNSKITLPTKDGAIDFAFMEDFISELEKQPLTALENYLTITGLKDYTLTEEEKTALSDFENAKIEWDLYKMDDLFRKVTTKKLPYKAANLPTEPIGENMLPCLTASFKNQGLNYFAPTKGATILKNVISLPSNSDVYRAYFQSNDFTVLSDAYAIDWHYNKEHYKAELFLFIVASINRVTDLPIYSYKNKLGGWNVVKSKYIQLPTKDKKPDYNLMQNLVRAIEKLVIKEVVLYAENKIQATQEAIK